MTKESSLQAIILAAGKGVRMRSALPKVLHKVCGRTLLERAVRVVAAMDVAQITVVAGYREDLVRGEVDRLQKDLGDSRLVTVVQSEQLGTGHAVQVALPKLLPGAPVLILPGDAPLLTEGELRSLVEEFKRSQARLTFLTVHHPTPTGFGRVTRTAEGKVSGIVEHKDCSPAQREITEINSGIYLAEHGFLTEALSKLRSDNAQGEYYLTDIVADGVASGMTVSAVVVPQFERCSGANSRLELGELELMRRREIVETLQLAGVTFEDVNAVYIDEGVEVGADCFVGAGTRLYGRTQIAESVHIEGDSLLRDATVGSGSVIKLGCHIERSVVGSACQVGPFAHLRPGSLLADRVKIGNFVETKNAKLAEGAKASHLTYLGDASVGVEANIGAGTITVNYDGVNKHHTAIGDGVFIGSNSALIAPVTIGRNAFVGAGSTITHDVPENALAVARARQRNIDEWTTRKKKKERGD